jgi:hypothetical protein
MHRYAATLALVLAGFAAFAFLAGWALSAIAGAENGLVWPYVLAGLVTLCSVIGLVVWALVHADHDDRIGRD